MAIALSDSDRELLGYYLEVVRLRYGGDPLAFRASLLETITLIADDDPSFRDFVRSSIEEAGEDA
jgi:hypothetical protein